MWMNFVYLSISNCKQGPKLGSSCCYGYCAVVCGVQRSAKGQEVFDKVCEHLSLASNEKDYFACSFKDEKRIRVSVDGTRVLMV